jgi:hypothetical protein
MSIPHPSTTHAVPPASSVSRALGRFSLTSEHCTIGGVVFFVSRRSKGRERGRRRLLLRPHDERQRHHIHDGFLALRLLMAQQSVSSLLRRAILRTQMQTQMQMQMQMQMHQMQMQMQMQVAPATAR